MRTLLAYLKKPFWASLALVIVLILVFLGIWAWSRSLAWDLASVLGKLTESVIAPLVWPAVVMLVVLLAHDVGLFGVLAEKLRELLKVSGFGITAQFRERPDRDLNTVFRLEVGPEPTSSQSDQNEEQ